MADTPLPEPNPADPDDPILSDAVRRRHLAAIAADPRNLLDDAAKRRISGARDRAALIQMRAVVEAETRYPSDSEQARIVLA